MDFKTGYEFKIAKHAIDANSSIGAILDLVCEVVQHSHFACMLSRKESLWIFSLVKDFH